MDQRVLELDEVATADIAQTTSEKTTPDPVSLHDDGLLSGWAQFEADVWGAGRSVQPLAGWLLSGLLGLVVWLTIVYAPGAFERAKLAHGADPKGVITVEAGYITILAVALIALAVAFVAMAR